MANSNSVKLSLKAARVNAGLTSSAAATALGIGRSTLYRYEQGVSEPRMALFLKMASVYGVSPDDIKQ